MTRICDIHMIKLTASAILLLPYITILHLEVLLLVWPQMQGKVIFTRQIFTVAMLGQIVSGPQLHNSLDTGRPLCGASNIYILYLIDSNVCIENCKKVLNQSALVCNIT